MRERSPVQAHSRKRRERMLEATKAIVAEAGSGAMRRR